MHGVRGSISAQPAVVLMNFGKALFVAWCAWIGSLMVGSVVVLL